jgi:hypothetical protein
VRGGLILVIHWIMAPLESLQTAACVEKLILMDVS